MGGIVNPEDSLDEEQPQDQDEGAEPSEQLNSDDSDDKDRFTNVTLQDINRDDLSPEMQAAYDNLETQYGSMQGDYTRSKQTMADNRRAAEAWASIESNPQLLRTLNDAIYKLDNGIPLDGQQSREQEVPPKPKPPSQEDDPEGYLKHMMREVFDEALAEKIPGLEQKIGTVTHYVRGQQTNLEFDNLVGQYPAVKNFGLEGLDRIRNQYQRSGGGVMTLRNALGIAAIDDPTLLTQVNDTASGKSKSSVGSNSLANRTRVELPSSGKTGRDILDLPDGVKSLHKRIEADAKSNLSLKEICQRGLAKLAGKGEITE